MSGEGTESEIEAPDPGMPSADRDSVTVTLPEEVGEWLDRQVAGQDDDRDRADVLRYLAAAYREVETEDGETTLDDLDQRLTAQREEYVELVEDVRGRVVDLRREFDDLADVDLDHDHDHDYAGGSDVDLDTLADRSQVEALAEEVEQLEQRTEGGFDNYETVLEELTDAVDRLDDRLESVAAVAADHHENDDRETALAEIRRRANEAGVREATCGECSTSHDVGLLTDSECPRCGSPFADVETGRWLIGSPTLVVGDPAVPHADANTDTDANTDRDANANVDANEDTGADVDEESGSGDGDENGNETETEGDAA
ncbi:hypothetical protein BRD13_03230 [Halobacteriales archaeon SW_5_70_135]|nr:MAG: hypothetical protein BRD13_03230 [Halobacteriales archaeon SW_5_70_135]